MSKISSFLGIRNLEAKAYDFLKIKDLFFGTEIELESFRFKSYFDTTSMKYWRYTEDGSLRPLNGTGGEFKFKTPLAGNDIILALKELDFLKKKSFREPPTFSERTGNHYHINVTNISTEELANVVINFIIFENVFYQIGSIKFDRINNAYCCPLINNEYLDELYYYYSIKNYNKFISVLIDKFHKYSSLYFNTNFGTLEFRLFDSAIQFPIILKHIEILSNFFINSKGNYVDYLPNNIRDLYIVSNPKKIFKGVYKSIDTNLKYINYKNFNKLNYLEKLNNKPSLLKSGFSSANINVVINKLNKAKVEQPMIFNYQKKIATNESFMSNPCPTSFIFQDDLQIPTIIEPAVFE